MLVDKNEKGEIEWEKRDTTDRQKYSWEWPTFGFTGLKMGSDILRE